MSVSIETEAQQVALQIRRSHDEYEALDFRVGGDEWSNRGACAPPEVDSSLFTHSTPETELTAKAICAQCVVALPCLEMGIRFHTTPLVAGEIWGGKTYAERKEILSSRSGVLHRQSFVDADDSV